MNRFVIALGVIAAGFFTTGVVHAHSGGLLPNETVAVDDDELDDDDDFSF